MGEIESVKKSSNSKLKFTVGSAQLVLPPGEYQAMVVEVLESEYQKKRPILEFIFEIVDGVYQGTRLRGFVNKNYKNFSNKTKLYEWYVAATGEHLESGQELCIDDFFRKVLTVLVATKNSRLTKNDFSNVVKIVGLYLDNVHNNKM